MPSLNDIKVNLRSLIADNKFPDFFDQLDEVILENGNCRNTMIGFKRQFNDLFYQVYSGTLTQEDRNTYFTKLAESLLIYIDHIGQTDIKQYKSKKGELIDSPLARTNLLVKELEELMKAEPKEGLRAHIWSFSFLSIFAVGKIDSGLEKSQPEYLKKLHAEKNALIHLLRRGFKMNCIICPASQYSLRARDEDIKRAMIRTNNLISFLKSDEDYLNNIDWAVSRYDYENRYIIGERSMFLGLRYGLEVGYGITYFTQDKNYISLKREFYESQFNDRSDLTLVRYGNKDTSSWRRKDLKREAVINCLEESLNYLSKIIDKE